MHHVDQYPGEIPFPRMRTTYIPWWIMVVCLCYMTGATSFEDRFTIAVLPDTQFYSSYYEESFQEQTAWACQCAVDPEMQVLFVSHLGDIVHRGNKVERDWFNAGRAMHTLLQCGLAHGILPGNHDTDHRMENPYHYFEKMFPVTYHKGKPWFGGSHSLHNMHNTYQLFASPKGDMKFVFLHLEYLPYSNESTSVIAWASKVIDDHPDRIALLSTHFAGSDCSDYIPYPVKTLLVKHCNLLMAFGGHLYACGGERSIPVQNQCNRTSYVFVSDYQGRNRGGNGWLRYYTFYPGENKVCAYTYSPPLTEFEMDENSYFSLDLTHGTLGPGCAHMHECRSHYVSPGFVLASVWIASALILFLYFLFLIYPSMPPQIRAIEQRYLPMDKPRVLKLN